MLLAGQFKRLKAACAVAALGSTVRAAEALHLSQSSVARAVQELEEALGQPLFERSGRGMRPAASAAQLLRRAARALNHLAHARPLTHKPLDAGLDWLGSRLALAAGQRHLQTMVLLAETSSETAAAQRLGISQSAVHQSLVQLEHMAAAPLFVRARKGLRLTEAAEAVLKAAKLCLAELQQAGDELLMRDGVVQGRIVIGTLPFSTGRLLAQSVDALLRAYPGLNITIIDGTYDALLHQLRHAEIDMVVGALRPALPGPDLEQETLFIDSLAVMARAGHPLARRPRLGWKDLRDAQWVMPMPNTPAQAAFERTLLAAGLPMPSSALRVNSALMMLAVLAQSDRLAMMAPRQLQREIEAGLLVELKLPVSHEPRMIGVIRRADYLPTPAAQMLADTLRDVAQAIAGTDDE